MEAIPGVTSWCRDEDVDGLGSDDCPILCAPEGAYTAVPPAQVKAFPELLRGAGYFTFTSEKLDYQFSDSALTGSGPQLARFLRAACLGVVVRDDLGLRRRDLGEALAQHLGDPAVNLQALALEHGLVSRVLDERVLEQVSRAWRAPALEEKLFLHELLEPLAQRLLVELHERKQQLESELATDDRGDL